MSRDITLSKDIYKIPRRYVCDTYMRYPFDTQVMRRRSSCKVDEGAALGRRDGHGGRRSNLCERRGAPDEAAGGGASCGAFGLAM